MPSRGEFFCSIRSLVFSCFVLLIGTQTLSAQQTANAIELYNDGILFQRQEQHFKAIEQFRSSVQINPRYLEPLIGLSESYFVLGEYQEALNSIRLAQNLDRQNRDLKTLEGRIRIGLGEFDAARGLFASVLDTEPNNIDALFGLAELDIAFGKSENAVSRYEAALRISPQNRRALLSLVIILDNHGKLENSITYVERVLLYHPDSALVRYIAAKHYLSKNALEDAEFHINVALRLNPEYLDATLLLSEIYLKQEKFEDAIEVISRILPNQREESILSYTLGIANLYLLRIDEALNDFARSFILKTDDEIARIALENLIISELSPDDARRQKFAEYHFELGAGYRDRNYLDRALREYRRGLVIDPHSREGRLRYAEIFNVQGFPAKYYDELTVLKRLGYDDIEISDKIEIQENILRDSISNKWNIEQYGLQRHKFKIAVYFLDSPMIHYLSEPELGTYFRHLLLRYENIDPRTARRSEGFSDAFESARKQKSDYFLLLQFQESQRHFMATYELFGAQAGTPLSSHSVFRTGNNRVADALYLLASDLHQKLPVIGTVLDLQFDTALIDLGTVDGIQEKQELFIIRSDTLDLKRDAVGLLYDEKDIVGTLNITESDELVSEGTVKRDLFFNFVNIGDNIVALEESIPETGKPQITNSIDLYRSVLKIR